MYPASPLGPPRRPSSVDEAIVGSFGPALPTCGDGRRDSLLPANSPETRERVPINQPESTSRACLLCCHLTHSLARSLVVYCVCLFCHSGRWEVARVSLPQYISIPIVLRSESSAYPPLHRASNCPSLACVEGFTPASDNTFSPKPAARLESWGMSCCFHCAIIYPSN